MGEIACKELVEALFMTRRYIKAWIAKGINKPNDYVLFCMSISQYLALLYADKMRFKVPGKDDYYEAYPNKCIELLLLPYRGVARMIVTHRNIFCHALGREKCVEVLNSYAKQLDRIKRFVNDVVMDNTQLQKETCAAIKNMESSK